MGNEQGRVRQRLSKQTSKKNPYRQEGQGHDDAPAAIPDQSQHGHDQSHGHGHGHGHSHGHCHDSDCTIHGGGSNVMIPTAHGRYAVL